MQEMPFKLTDLIDSGQDFLDGIFSAITNGVTITDQYSVILYVNPGFTNITGYSKEEVLGGNPGILHSGRHNKDYYETMWKLINKNNFWSGEIWNRHKSGRLLPEWVTITKLQAKDEVYYISVFSDITELVKKNQEKVDLAYSDPLTGLHNRLYLKQLFSMYKKKFEKEKNSNNKIALLFIDVNKFKLINDQYGHLVGDNVLRYISDIIKISIRNEDIAIRYGGDEFVVILDDIDSKNTVIKICERISSELSAPFKYENNQIQVRISVGVALYPLDAENLSELIVVADKAMYESKYKNKYLTFATPLI